MGDAVDQLKKGKVLQTVRSYKSAAPLLQMRGRNVGIFLDEIMLYEARITDIRSKVLSNLNDQDSDMGGFKSLEALRDALKRAGFRFKQFYEYRGFVIQFQKVNGEKP